eukprot:3583868-Rhodomonas_salina.2
MCSSCCSSLTRSDSWLLVITSSSASAVVAIRRMELSLCEAPVVRCCDLSGASTALGRLSPV